MTLNKHTRSHFNKTITVKVLQHTLLSKERPSRCKTLSIKTSQHRRLLSDVHDSQQNRRPSTQTLTQILTNIDMLPSLNQRDNFQTYSELLLLQIFRDKYRNDKYRNEGAATALFFISIACMIAQVCTTTTTFSFCFGFW